MMGKLNSSLPATTRIAMWAGATGSVTFMVFAGRWSPGSR
jgi:hypothetical protein